MIADVKTWYELQAHKQFGSTWKLQDNDIHTGSILISLDNRKLEVTGTIVKPAIFKEITNE